MKNQRGFTLIELLATILILGIIMVIAVPTVSYLINGNNREYYSGLEKMTLSSGKDYFMDNRKVLPKQVGSTTKISLDTLVNKAYIDPVKDKDGNLCFGNVIVTKVTSKEYSYLSCLVCGDDYVTEGCNDMGVTDELLIPSFDVVPLGWSQKKKVTIKYPNGYLNQYTITSGSKWYDYKEPIQITDNTNIIARVKQGNNSILSSTQTVNQIDRTVPIEAKFTYVSTTKSITVTASGKDLESGVSRYQFSKDNGVTWTSSQESPIYTFDNLVTGTYPIKVRVINGTFDNDGIDNNYLDSEKQDVATKSLTTPTFTVNPLPVTYSWTQGRKIIINGTTGYDLYYSYDRENWTKYTNQLDVKTNNKTIYARLNDGVNNSTNATLTVVGIDLTAPTSATFTYRRTISTIEVTAIGVDGESGIARYQFSKDNGSTWTSIQSSNVYTFTGLSTEVDYPIKVRVINNTYLYNSLNSLNYIDSPSKNIRIIPLVKHVQNLYNSGDSTLVKDNTGDANIRYYGRTVNNYISIGGQNYRMIGVMNNVTTGSGAKLSLVKAMKKSSITRMYWNYNGNNNWDNSTLKNYYNSTGLGNYYWNNSSPITDISGYMSNIGSALNNIETVVWKLGSYAPSLTLSSLNVYNSERGNTKNSGGYPTTWTGKVGAPYISDFSYASNGANCWNYYVVGQHANSIYNKYCKDYNWMDVDTDSFWSMSTPTVQFNGDDQAYYVCTYGYISYNNVKDPKDTRPTVYLTADTIMASGTGTSTDPYKITD